MGKEVDPLERFAEVLDELLMTKLAEADEMIRTIDENYTEQEIIKILVDANSLVRLVCGADTDLYEEWHYRLIRAEKGKYIIIQGKEIDVENGDGLSISEE